MRIFIRVLNKLQWKSDRFQTSYLISIQLPEIGASIYVSTVFYVYVVVVSWRQLARSPLSKSSFGPLSQNTRWKSASISSRPNTSRCGVLTHGYISIVMEWSQVMSVSYLPLTYYVLVSGLYSLPIIVKITAPSDTTPQRELYRRRRRRRIPGQKLRL